VFSPKSPAAPPSRSSRPRFDDDLPASIPIAAARPWQAVELDDFDASIALAEDLVDQLDEFATMELATDEPEPAPEPQAPPAAANPFAEPFADEEILVDPYADFDAQLVRTAQQVMNRIDRTFAAELARCELRKSKPAAAPAVLAAAPAVPLVAKVVPTAPTDPAPLPDAVVAQFPTKASSANGHAAPSADRHTPGNPAPAAVVPGRQFRRLFTSLEAASPRRQQG
jgi:hypothetical protein